jgi:class 3 adenylate cyclase
MATAGGSATETSTEYQGLIRYLPRHRRVAFDPRSLRSFPLFVSAPASVLCSDIVDFTALTDRMVRSGIGGAEQLADVMNKVISRMAEIAWEQGGELVNWEGDAGTFVWFAREGLSIDDATVLAVQVASAIHREAKSWLVDGAAIRFRSAIGSGLLAHFEIGGNENEWHSALAGETLLDVIAAERAAAPEEILLSRSALALVAGRCKWTPAGEGRGRVLGVISHASPPETPPPSGDVPERILRKAVPQIVLGGRQQSTWPGDFRLVTAAYVRLRHPDYALPEDTLATLQDAAERVQKVLARFEGQIYEIVAENEGITFIAVFGLPPWSHEDDAARAVKSALTLHREWGALGLTSSTGIATGRIFCGTFQTKTDRAVLALVGPIMNLAARLMQLNAGVVCDEETRQAGRQSGRIYARQMTPKMVKGKSEPITAFAAYDVGGLSSPQRGTEEATPIGREHELSVLTDGVAKTRAGIGGVVIIEGDAGIGKSTLVNRAVAEARDKSMVVLAGDGDSTDQTTPYLAWRRVFLELLARSDLTLRVAAKRSSLPGTDAEPVHAGSGKPAIPLAAFAHLGPLLEDMLGLEAVDNGETVLLSGQARADALARLLQDMLLEAAKTSPILVVVEDMHWLDPTSLSFFAALGGGSRAPLMLLGATRSPDANPAVRTSLAQVADVQWLRPQPMNSGETGRLLARTLGARAADDDLAAMFRDRTGGNPLFVEELSRMAFANRLLFIDGAVQARSSVANAKVELDDILERQGLPGTIEGVIRRRLDGLSNQDISVLRAASVVGQAFDRDLCSAGVRTLSPVEVERSLGALTGLGVIEPLDRAPDNFVFRHEVLRDVVYNTMSFAERRQLHDSIGSWIEGRPHTEDVSALLGRHFLHAQRTDKAIRYLVAAGELAFRRYANEEAVEILLRARELDLARPDANSGDEGMGRPDKAHLSLLLGRACLGLSRYADCRTHSETGLRLAGFPAAASSFGVALGILKQAINLARQRFRPPARQPEKALLRESILAFEALAETYYFSGDGLRTLNAAMNTLNLSERLGASPELARGCATLSGIAGLFRLQAVSRHYSARALGLLAELEDPAAEAWVFNLLGLSGLGEGRWEESRTSFANVVSAAERIGDRRRWRDGVENGAVIEACCGRWEVALGGLTAMLDAAKQAKDQRYTVLASRERAYCALQLGDLRAVEEDMRLVREELARGLAAEQLPTRVDLHAITATLALERRNYVQAASEADTAMKAILQMGATSSVANAYWAMFLVARVFANAWLNSARKDAADRVLLKGMAAACRALSNQAFSHPIAAPSAAIVRGYLASLQGRPATSKRLWRRAAAKANRLDMVYEARLALHALGEASERDRETSGIPFFIDDGSADVR